MQIRPLAKITVTPIAPTRVQQASTRASTHMTPAPIQPPARMAPTTATRVQPTTARTASARVQPAAISPALAAPARIQRAPAVPAHKATHASKKEDISMLHLPISVREDFRVRFVPLLREFAGSVGPWDSLTEDQIAYIWYGTFPDFNSQIEDDLLWIVTKLVSHSPLFTALLTSTV